MPFAAAIEVSIPRLTALGFVSSELGGVGPWMPFARSGILGMVSLEGSWGVAFASGVPKDCSSSLMSS